MINTPLKIGVDVSELRALQAAFAQAPDATQRELMGFMASVTGHLEAEAKLLTPTTHGLLRGSIFGSVSPLAGIGVEGIVGSALNYALPLELGSRPHMPPIEPLVGWARQKFALNETDARRTAWGVAKAIARRGTLGVGMFHRAWSANRAQVEARFSDAVRRIVGRIGGAQ